jgi:hypothetical protein
VLSVCSISFLFVSGLSFRGVHGVARARVRRGDQVHVPVGSNKDSAKAKRNRSAAPWTVRWGHLVYFSHVMVGAGPKGGGTWALFPMRVGLVGRWRWPRVDGT